MLNKVSTVSILLIIAIALIIVFGVKNGKKSSVSTTNATSTNAAAESSAFRGKR